MLNSFLFVNYGYTIWKSFIKGRGRYPGKASGPAIPNGFHFDCTVFNFFFRWILQNYLFIIIFYLKDNCLTILCFCHTSTLISHRYTYVPSLLNLCPTSHPIPLLNFWIKKIKSAPFHRLTRPQDSRTDSGWGRGGGLEGLQWRTASNSDLQVTFKK